VQGGSDRVDSKELFLMTIDYKIDKKDLTEYLVLLAKKNKSISRTLLIFNLLIICGICLVVFSIITKSIWPFTIGASLLGLNAYRPNLKKEANKKVSELEKENKLKTCFGDINLTVEKDGLLIKNGFDEERISASNLSKVQIDDNYLTIVVAHGLLFIPVKRFETKEDKLKLVDAIENIRLDDSVRP
jgi:hypothetical protein